MSTYTYREVVTDKAWDKTRDKIKLVEDVAWRAIHMALEDGAINCYDVAIDIFPNFDEGAQNSKVVTVEVYYGNDMRRV